MINKYIYVQNINIDPVVTWFNANCVELVLWDAALIRTQVYGLGVKLESWGI